MSCYDKTKHVGGVDVEKIQRTIEVERIVNLVRGFGWDIIESKTDGDVLRLIIEKKVMPPAAPAP